MNTSETGDKQRGQTEPSWHSIGTDKVLSLIESNMKTGLELEEINKRLKSYGPNKLSAKVYRIPGPSSY